MFEQQPLCVVWVPGADTLLLRSSRAPRADLLLQKLHVIPQPSGGLAGHAQAWWDYGPALFFWMSRVLDLAAFSGFTPGISVFAKSPANVTLSWAYCRPALLRA